MNWESVQSLTGWAASSCICSSCKKAREEQKNTYIHFMVRLNNRYDRSLTDLEILAVNMADLVDYNLHSEMLVCFNLAEYMKSIYRQYCIQYNTKVSEDLTLFYSMDAHEISIIEIVFGMSGSDTIFFDAVLLPKDEEEIKFATWILEKFKDKFPENGEFGTISLILAMSSTMVEREDKPILDSEGYAHFVLKTNNDGGDIPKALPSPSYALELV